MSAGLDFLLEVGTEEIPDWMIPSAVAQLQKLDLFGAVPHVDATPRRLVVRASGLPERTPDQTQIVKGPPLAAGEKAAAGFARKQGVELSAMAKTGDYWELTKVIPGRPVRELLAGSLPVAVLALQWPKTMYWEPTGARFIRPIRWIVAVLGDEVIPFEIAGVKSGNVTRGHRRLGLSSIPVTVANYESELRRNFVILSSVERRRKIETETAALGAKPDAGLLETLTFITEFPTAIRGDFDPAYLELPAEVLTTVMRHHQKYFSVESAPSSGGGIQGRRLAPHFVAVMNTSGDPEGLVKKGNERVLKARFNDARFFWNVDQHKKLADRVEDLSHVTFHAKLGSYLEKTKRVVEVVKKLKGDENAQRAALLSKADLPTEMVKEFTDLQGIVGGLYAQAQGEPEAVWRAIYGHYKPLSMEDSIPATLDGQIVALADKLDTLQQCFRIGLVPTGSKDPFALRRAAQGVVKILVEGKLYYELDELVHFENVDGAAAGGGDLRAFLIERMQHYFREVRGFQYDEVNAVLASRTGTLADVEARLTALAAVRPTENFEPLAASFKRIRNILKQAEFDSESWLFDVQLLEAGPERNLYDDFIRAKNEASGKTYARALEAIASIRPNVDTFFDKVLVNAKDESVRSNRLALLHAILTEFSTIADFSELVTSGL
jgi:glycyl-tRNA synthetase beta chain